MDIKTEFEEKVRRGIFRPVARHLTNPNTAEDRMQEAVCMTWDTYRRYAEEKGKILDDALLVHICRLKATDLDRHFVPANGRRRRDVMNPRCYHAGEVEVLRLDMVAEDAEGYGYCPQPIGFAEEGLMSPERKWASALDLEDWLEELPERDQTIMTGKMLGETNGEIGAEVGLSHSSVCRRAKELGLKLAARAGILIDLSNQKRGRPRTTNIYAVPA